VTASLWGSSKNEVGREGSGSGAPHLRLLFVRRGCLQPEAGDVLTSSRLACPPNGGFFPAQPDRPKARRRPLAQPA
jgi:hypothetical protein